MRGRPWLAGGDVNTTPCHDSLGIAWIWRVQQGAGFWQPFPAACTLIHLASLAGQRVLMTSECTCREKAQGRVVTMAYADAFGEAGIGGTLSYYLASAFEKVSSGHTT
jgi:hypothetical protein